MHLPKLLFLAGLALTAPTQTQTVKFRMVLHPF